LRHQLREQVAGRQTQPVGSELRDDGPPGGVPQGAVGLRYGEDVDLVWRLHDAGWQVRYDPRTCVEHAEPERWLPWLLRRHAYGTSAAPLLLALLAPRATRRAAAAALLAPPLLDLLARPPAVDPVRPGRGGSSRTGSAGARCG